MPPVLYFYGKSGTKWVALTWQILYNLKNINSAMIEKHIDENQLRQKITDLFEYRLFPLLSYSSNRDEAFKSQFFENLIQLQQAIYYLDAHLETQWHTKGEVLNWHWENIRTKLMAFDISEEGMDQYLNHIKKYEKHELELRQGKSPLRFDMEYFYFYKSCDVKLLRRLIYEKLQLTTVCGKLSDWRYYDLVTEVNDDVEDVFEDIGFINGNRFLISLIKYGHTKTYDTFLHFLKELEENARHKHQTSEGVFRDVIYKSTILRLKETKELLNQRISEVTTEHLQSSTLFKHLMILSK